MRCYLARGKGSLHSSRLFPHLHSCSPITSDKLEYFFGCMCSVESDVKKYQFCIIQIRNMQRRRQAARIMRSLRFGRNLYLNKCGRKIGELFRLLCLPPSSSHRSFEVSNPSSLRGAGEEQKNYIDHNLQVKDSKEKIIFLESVTSVGRS